LLLLGALLLLLRFARAFLLATLLLLLRFTRRLLLLARAALLLLGFARGAVSCWPRCCCCALRAPPSPARALLLLLLRSRAAFPAGRAAAVAARRVPLFLLRCCCCARARPFLLLLRIARRALLAVSRRSIASWPFAEGGVPGAGGAAPGRSGCAPGPAGCARVTGAGGGALRRRLRLRRGRVGCARTAALRGRRDRGWRRRRPGAMAPRAHGFAPAAQALALRAAAWRLIARCGLARTKSLRDGSTAVGCCVDRLLAHHFRGHLHHDCCTGRREANASRCTTGRRCVREKSRCWSAYRHRAVAIRDVDVHVDVVHVRRVGAVPRLVALEGRERIPADDGRAPLAAR
jgi:hypothetical protein